MTAHTAIDTTPAASPAYIARMKARRTSTSTPAHVATTTNTQRLDAPNGYTYFFIPRDNGTTIQMIRYSTTAYNAYKRNPNGPWPTRCLLSTVPTPEARERWTDLKTGRDRNPNGVTIY